jgi:tetratricopeptide (TPR) repeat protein
MSPEQAGMSDLDVDTRSDVYSLGVLLYELLTGTTPFARDRFSQSSYDEIRRIIREEDPPRPSTRLTTLGQGAETVSANRGSDARQLSRAIRGDLDWIVMKALEKDRNRRYETATGFAADVQRYLNDEPVQACPPSPLYRLRKFARRHKGPVLVSAVVLLAPLVGVIGTTWGMLAARQAEARATADRDRAQKAEADTKAFSEFLVSDVLSAPRPAGLQQGMGRDVTVVQALEHTEKKLDRRFADRPVAEATARHALGVTWRHLGNFPKAEAYLRRALELRLQFLGSEHRDTYDTQNSLGVLLTTMGKADEAVPLLEAALSGLRGDDRAHANDTVLVQVNLGRALTLVDRTEEAIRLLEDARERCRSLPQASVAHAETQSELGRAFLRAGRLTEAVPLLEEAHQRFLKAGHPTMGVALILGECYRKAGRHADACALVVDVLRRERGVLGDDHPGTLKAMEELATSYFQEKRWPEVIQLLEEALRLREARFGAESPEAFPSTYQLAQAYSGARRYVDAQHQYDMALKLARHRFGDDHISTIVIMYNRANAYLSVDPAASIPLFEEAVALYKAKLGADHKTTLFALRRLASVYRRAGQVEKAIAAYEEEVTLATAKSGPHDLSAENSMRNIASLHEERAEFARAEAWWRRTVGAARGRNDDPLRLANNLMGLGLNLERQRKWVEGEKIVRECLDLRERNGAEKWQVATAKRLLGQLLAGQRKFTEAEPLLLAGFRGLKENEQTIPALVRSQRIREAAEFLIQLYEAWDKHDEATNWRKELQALTSKEAKEKP